MITSLTLRNFRRHEDFSTTFGPGLNVICGPNWAGKSTILSGMLYGLFGSKAGVGAVDSLTTLSKKGMEVAVGFTVNEKDYLVTRGKSKADLVMVSGDTQIATGQTPVTEEIESLIGISAKDFVSFHLTRQEEASSLLTLSSAKLGEYVAQITGMNVIDAVLEQARFASAEVSGQLNALAATKTDPEPLRKELGDLEGAYSRLYADLKLQSSIAQSLKNAYQDAQEDRDQLQQAHAAAAQWRHQHDVAIGVLNHAKASLEVAKEAVPAPPAEGAENLLAEYRVKSAALKEYEEWAKQLNEARAAVPKAEQAVAGWRETLENTPKPDEGVSQRIMTAQLAVEEARRELGTAERAMSNAICPTCERPFEDSDLGALRAHWEEKESRCAEAEEEFQAAHDAADANAVKIEQLGVVETALGAWERHLGELTAHLQALTGAPKEEVTDQELERLERALNKLEGEQKAYDRAVQEVSRWEESIRTSQKTLSALGQAEKGPGSAEVLQAEKKEKRAQEDLYSASLALSKLESEAQMTYAAIDSMKQSLEVAEQSFKHYAGALERSQNLTELTKFLRSNRDRFTNSVWEQILGFATKFVQQATGGDVTELSRNDKGDFVYTEGAESMPVSDMASGMQKAIFSTAVKIALASAMASPFDVLLFDEVTAAASDDTSLLFTSVLTGAGSQVVLVTHRQADAAVADHLVAL